MSSTSNSPCAACKIQRRKCTQECIFAPYFPPDDPQRFAYVHKVFGASNVSKLLNELNAAQREDAVKSLAYEAEARLRDPVYGCVGVITVLQRKLKQLQNELNHAKKELATYVGPHVLFPLAQAQAQAPAQPASHLNVFPTFQNTLPPQAHPEVLRLNNEGGSTSQAGFNVIPNSHVIGNSGECYNQFQTQQNHQSIFTLTPQPYLSPKRPKSEGSPACFLPMIGGKSV